MRWGFVSSTAKEPKLAPINARAETLSTSPMFRDAFRRHRCLVVADGFYEWRKNDGRKRAPFFIRLSPVVPSASPVSGPSNVETRGLAWPHARLRLAHRTSSWRRSTTGCR
jgi:hypothetical protein